MQSDNTVKEIRNQHGAKFLASMAQAGLWGVASCHHLQVGHTHEDVDSVFSLVAMALGSAPSLQSPMDVAKRIESKLSHLWTKKGLVFSIELVDTVARIWKFCLVCFEVLELDLPGILVWCEKSATDSKVRDWKAILPDNITMKNAFRGRKWLDDEGVNEGHAPLPHSFTYMPRAGQGN